MNFLSISIITYNDLFNLKKQLNLLCSIKLPVDVKIRVYDNNSGYDVFHELRCFENVEIYKHTSNIGADANVAYALGDSDSKWTWVLSTNDFVRDDLVLELIEILRSKSSLAVFLHSRHDGKLIQLKNLAYFQDKYERLFHISSIIFNTEVIKDKLYLYNKYLITQQAQFYFLLELFLEKTNEIRCFEFVRLNVFTLTSAPGWDKTQFLNSNLNIINLLTSKEFYFLRKVYGNNFLRTFLMIIYLGYKDDPNFEGKRFLKKYFDLYFSPTLSGFMILYPFVLIFGIRTKLFIFRLFQDRI